MYFYMYFRLPLIMGISYTYTDFSAKLLENSTRYNCNNNQTTADTIAPEDWQLKLAEVSWKWNEINALMSSHESKVQSCYVVASRSSLDFLFDIFLRRCYRLDGIHPQISRTDHFCTSYHPYCHLSVHLYSHVRSQVKFWLTANLASK